MKYKYITKQLIIIIQLLLSRYLLLTLKNTVSLKRYVNVMFFLINNS